MSRSENEKVVYIVHSVDTEGPLYESLEETFKRVENIFGVRIPPSEENLEKLRRGEVDLDGREEQAARMFSRGLLEYNEHYGKLEAMLDRIGSEEFRRRLPDSYGNGWIFNWHCVDHIGYGENPRRKDMGFHNIFDYYRSFIERTDAPDSLHWHFHPMHWTRASHRNATRWLGDNRFFEVIARRILQREWFPSVNRAGFHTERPDSHWLLEQWIPFDLSNQRFERDDEQDDVKGGRFGDWRRAPASWTVYQPSHDDYQVPGGCRRYIGRCLNVGTRYKLLDRGEVEKAFREAQREGRALMGFTDHDFRDMAPDVNRVRDMIAEVKEEYPGVKFRYCDAREAFNRYLWGEYRPPEKNILSLDLDKGYNATQVRLSVESSEPTFGPQPFLAVETMDGKFLHDNFDFERPFREWSYIFDHQSVEWEKVRRVGVATNDRRGFPHIRSLSRK